jgi:hypothetical protein
MMKKLFLKLLLIASPVLAILGVYAWKDPFKVLYHYDTYFQPRDSSLIISYNEDRMSTQTLINNYPKYHYNSFILGGSRSGLYPIDEWLKHIGPDCQPYHFDGNEEDLYGLYHKLMFLDKIGADLKHVLIVTDAYSLKDTTNSESYLTIKDPAVSGQNKLKYQLVFVKAFFDRKFLLSYMDYQRTGLVKPYMSKWGTIRRSYIAYDNRYNESRHISLDDSIRLAKDRYYEKLRFRFFRRPSTQHYTEQVLSARHIQLLKEMRAILQKHHTDCKIVINPLYDQVKINAADLAVLKDIFGAGNVFDFSGINDITEDKYNYYENSHYLPRIAVRIMDSVYSLNGSMAE